MARKTAEAEVQAAALAARRMFAAMGATTRAARMGDEQGRAAFAEQARVARLDAEDAIAKARGWKGCRV